jgi:hypothetical protein
MQIVCKKRYQFIEHQITTHPRNGEQVAKVLRTFNVTPSLRPVEVPDWIRQNDLFDIAMADGSVIVIGELPVKKSKQPIPEPQQAAQSDEEKQAKIRTMLDTPIAELTGGIAGAHFPTMGKTQFPSPGLI